MEGLQHVGEVVNEPEPVGLGADPGRAQIETELLVHLADHAAQVTLVEAGPALLVVEQIDDLALHVGDEALVAHEPLRQEQLGDQHEIVRAAAQVGADVLDGGQEGPAHRLLGQVEMHLGGVAEKLRAHGADHGIPAGGVHVGAGEDGDVQIVLVQDHADVAESHAVERLAAGAGLHQRAEIGGDQVAQLESQPGEDLVVDRQPVAGLGGIATERVDAQGVEVEDLEGEVGAQKGALLAVVPRRPDHRGHLPPVIVRLAPEVHPPGAAGGVEALAQGRSVVPDDPGVLLIVIR